MTSDLQQLIKFPVGASFPSFETVQRSSHAMHMRLRYSRLASNRLLRSLCLFHSLSASQMVETMPLLRILFKADFFAMSFQTKVLKSNYV